MADVARGLALALIDGAWEMPLLRRRAQAALGQRPRWLTPLLRRVLARFPEPPAEPEALEQLIRNDDALGAELAQSPHPVRIRRWFTPEQQMRSVSGPPAGFGVPAIATEGELAELLGVTDLELDWFADTRHLNGRPCDPRLRHYSYRWVTKRSGGHRLLESPKRRIKAIQRRLLGALLSSIPASEHAHGFASGRSVHSFAAPHVGKRVVVRLDLQDFFTAVTAARIAAVFRRVGYPRSVAAKLAGLCTTATPEDVLSRHPRARHHLAERFQTISRLRCAHLPQGAPTSPALSNLAALSLDRRLAGLAASAGADYTRYADDMAFSGGPELERVVTRFVHLAGGIALDEGFEINYRKSRVMRSGRRQQIAGLVVNQRPNIKRADYDALRALLHNAARLGPESQNRDGHADFRAHLEGRIAWVAATNSGRGDRLRRLFEAIAWPASER